MGVSSKEVARIGLTRQLVGATWSSLAREVNRPEATCRRQYERHLRAIRSEPLYADAIAMAAHRALDLTFRAGR